MTTYVRALGLIACAWLLSACSSMPTQAYNKAESNVHTVGLAPPGIPAEPSVRILASVGANFGLIGGIVEATREANASKELQEIFAQTGYDYKKDFRDSLALAFTGSSLDVKAPTGDRPAKEQFKFLTTCPAAPGSDACLDVYLTYIGYMSAGATTDYMPTLHLTARMVRADGTQLFQDAIHYNPLAGSKAIVVQPSDKYRFKDRDAMKADPKAVTEGIKEAVRAVTVELSKQFM
jgi:hypothetical protein